MGQGDGALCSQAQFCVRIRAMEPSQHYDAVIIGAGAAGLFCAGLAGQRGLKVLLLDHSPKIAEKIRISGGGRANFTNRDVSAANFISNNPNFCRSALSRYTPQDFMDLMRLHGITFHEKHKGQLFCDRSAEDLIQMLLNECRKGKVDLINDIEIFSIDKNNNCLNDNCKISYIINIKKDINNMQIFSNSIIIATGGLSIPKIGATGFGYQLARQFGLNIVAPRPALVPLTFDGEGWAAYASLAGLALPVIIETGSKKTKTSFAEDLLFTHRGLSGPAVLQISSYWLAGTPIRINLVPQVALAAHLLHAKTTSKKRIVNELAALVPSRLAEAWVAQDVAWQRPVNEAADKALIQLAERLSRWEITPTGTEGYKKAEVTAGGIDTRELNSQTMESRIPGLYFIGEVIDVTGWLGGYNFQWAWASAFACAQALKAETAVASEIA